MLYLSRNDPLAPKHVTRFFYTKLGVEPQLTPQFMGLESTVSNISRPMSDSIQQVYTSSEASTQASKRTRVIETARLWEKAAMTRLASDAPWTKEERGRLLTLQLRAAFNSSSVLCRSPPMKSTYFPQVKP